MRRRRRRDQCCNGADAFNATSANEEQANLRKTLTETEREGEGDGGPQCGCCS